MHRDPLLKLLQAYRLRYPQEAAAVDQYIDFVQAHENCFSRTQLSGHVTGSAWLVNRAGTHVLLTHHRKLNIWVQLGGHADGQTDILAAARREAIEESGIESLATLSAALFNIDIHPIPERGDEPAHLHYDATFTFQATDSDDFVVSEESHALEWVEVSRLAEKTSEHCLLRMAAKWQAAGGQVAGAK